MYLILGCEDVRGVTEVRKPHVLNVSVIKCLGSQTNLVTISSENHDQYEPCRLID